ncbi:MAG: hypothetical protein RL398_3658 [Planctomycetota bacterium]
MTNGPQTLCTTPTTAVLLDVDKSVRPCCAYEGAHLKGSYGIEKLGERTLREVLDGSTWQGVRDALDRGEIPSGCANCLERERLVGNSQRTVMEQRLSPQWRDGITYFELSSSNLCNLQCRHCAPLFSSRWSAHRTRQGWTDVAPIVRPNAEVLRRSLQSVDLSHLEFVSLKGGEPMLNADVLVLLDHLDDLGVLERVTVSMVTNGIVIDERILAKLRKAKKVTACLSIDGFGPVQTYIRHGGSELEKIAPNVHRYAQEPNFFVTRNTSVMAYNVFSLDRIDAWWDALAAAYPGKFHHRYGLFVLWPEHLAISCLQDATRHRLHEKYAALDPKRYAPVLRALELPYAGDAMHDRFVDQTNKLDRELGRAVLDAVPELRDEMERITPLPAVETVCAAIDAAERPCEPAPAEPVEPPPAWLDLPQKLQEIWQHLNAGELATARLLADQCHGLLAQRLPTPLRAGLLHAQGAVAGLSGSLRLAERLLAEAADLLPNNTVIREHLARARGGEAAG